MNIQLEVITPFITASNGRAVTTSQAIAAYFMKRHDDVLKKIRNLECSPDFLARNFAVCYENSELQNGKSLPYYEMTKDGFVFLAMGFTGKKAAAFKEAYINAFNKMEVELLSQAPAIMANQCNCRVLHTYDSNGVIIHSRVAKDDELLTSPKNFVELMHKRGYVMVRTEDFSNIIIS